MRTLVLPPNAGVVFGVIVSALTILAIGTIKHFSAEWLGSVFLLTLGFQALIALLLLGKHRDETIAFWKSKMQPTQGYEGSIYELLIKATSGSPYQQVPYEDLVSAIRSLWALEQLTFQRYQELAAYSTRLAGAHPSETDERIIAGLLLNSRLITAEEWPRIRGNALRMKPDLWLSLLEPTVFQADDFEALTRSLSFADAERYAFSVRPSVSKNIPPKSRGEDETETIRDKTSDKAEPSADPESEIIEAEFVFR